MDLLPPERIQANLARGIVKAKARQAAIHTMFEEAGCPVEEQRVGRNTANVICRLPGKADSTIVIGGHFDFVEHGQGIVDDWSGTALLPALYQALSAMPRMHTFIFVAFASEEAGLIGSTRYVKELSKEDRSHVQAFVNLECLGLGPAEVWVHRATPPLVSRLMDVANSLHTSIVGMNVDNVGNDDSQPFVSAGMPVITLHSVTQETLHILHSSKDRIEAIKPEDYYSSYKLAAYYLADLDLKTN